MIKANQSPMSDKVLFDLSEDIDYSLFKLGKSGRVIKLLYNNSQIQIPSSTMISPFGTKSYSKDWSTYDEYQIDCSIKMKQQTPNKFKEFLEKMDTIIIKLVKDNISFFNSKKEQANENFTYNSILRENGSYPKLMKLNLPRDKNGNFETICFDEKGNKIKLTEENVGVILCAKRLLKCIIECSKVWYYNDKIGVQWNLTQCKYRNIEQPATQDTSLSKEQLNKNLLMDED